MMLVDAHLDLAWNALNWNRDLTKSVAEIRTSEAQMQDFHRGNNTVSFPEMRKAEVGVCLATLLARASKLGDPLLDYRSLEIASAMARGQLAYYRIMEALGEMRMIIDRASLDAHLEEVESNGIAQSPLGFILAMEGADPILSPAHVVEWWGDGLRVIEPVHYDVNRYAHGTGSPGDLTPYGCELLKAMDEVGMILDVTHLADDAFWQAVDLFKGRVLASHHNCRALVPGDRQLTDEQIRTLIERDAVIGAAFDVWMLYPNWVPQVTPNSVVSMEAVVDHIDHVCQLAGNSRHAAIGSDLDGGFGREQSPADLDTIADVQKLPGLLAKRGYTTADIEAIMHGNWIRFFREALPQR